MLCNDILIEIKRDGIVEKAYPGAVIALDKNGKVICDFSYNGNQNIILRSMQKPFQAYSFIKSGAYKKFAISPKELAVISGSHAGTFTQVKLVKEILRKSKVKLRDLQCPEVYPLDEKTKQNLIKADKEPLSIYDNCSGKHAGMLSSCRAFGFELKNYKDENHPIQQKIIKDTLELCEFDKKIVAKDGCGVPVLAMPIFNMAKGLQNLYKTEEGRLIISSCIKYPMIFGGNNRFDTDIIKLTNGKVFAKVGAAGLVGALNLETQESLVVKIFADDHPARAEVMLDYMKKLNWI